MPSFSPLKGSIHQAHGGPGGAAENPAGRENKPLPAFRAMNEGRHKTGSFVFAYRPAGQGEEEKTAEVLLQEAREKARFLEQEAYEKGFAQGEKDGLEMADRKAQKVLAHLKSVSRELVQIKESLVKAHEKDVLTLIFSIAEKVLLSKIDRDETVIKKAVSEALELITERQEVNLRISPGDHAYLESVKPAFFEAFHDLKTLTITADPAVSRGGCVLATPHGQVDGTLERRIAAVFSSLEKV